MYRLILEEELRIQKDTGYEYFNDSSHPLAYQAGKVYYHRHVASVSLGRWLSSEEHVHHIDGNRQNNTPSNLMVLSPKEHGELHHQVELEMFTCKFCKKEQVRKFKTQKYCDYGCCHSDSVRDLTITKEVLQELIDNGTSYKEIGAMFNYSASGIRKRAKSLGCILPVRRKRGPKD